MAIVTGRANKSFNELASRVGFILVVGRKDELQQLQD
jgi:hypothetical protein